MGGATTTPLRMLPLLGWKGLLGEFEGRLAIGLMSRLPSTRRARDRATIRLAETPETIAKLPISLQPGTMVVNRAALSRVPQVEPRERADYLLFPSALQGRKGARLVLRALSATPASVHLRFVCDGYEEPWLRKKTKKLGLEQRVDFHGRIPREKMFEMMSEAAGVVFAGLREEGGCGLAEAMLVGAPVIVLAYSGAKVIAQTNTDPARVALIAARNPRQAAGDMSRAMVAFTTSPSTVHGSTLDQSAVEKVLCSAVIKAIAHDAASAAADPPVGPGQIDLDASSSATF